MNGVPRPIDAKGETDAAVRIDVKSTVGRGRTAMIVGKQQTAVSKIDEAAPTAAKRRRPGRKASLRTGVNQCAGGINCRHRRPVDVSPWQPRRPLSVGTIFPGFRVAERRGRVRWSASTRRLLVDLSDRSAIFESESGRGFRRGIDPDHDAIEGFVLEMEAH